MFGEPMIQNMTSTTDGATQAIIGLNKVAWQPAVVDQNDNVIYLEEEELRQQMVQVEEGFEGGPQPSPLSTSYTMDGTERIVSSGMVLDVNGFDTGGIIYRRNRRKPSAKLARRTTIS